MDMIDLNNLTILDLHQVDALEIQWSGVVFNEDNPVCNRDGEELLLTSYLTYGGESLGNPPLTWTLGWCSQCFQEFPVWPLCWLKK